MQADISALSRGRFENKVFGVLFFIHWPTGPLTVEDIDHQQIVGKLLKEPFFCVDEVDIRQGQKPDWDWLQIERDWVRDLPKISGELICGHCLVWRRAPPTHTCSGRLPLRFHNWRSAAAGRRPPPKWVSINWEGLLEKRCKKWARKLGGEVCGRRALKSHP